MMNKLYLFIIFLFIRSYCFPQKINRYKNKERQGKWIIYSDSTNTHIDEIGRYKKGNQKGVWKSYDNDVLVKKEIYRFKKISTTYYYPNGMIAKKGKSKIVLEGNLLHFYFYGNWLLFDSTGSVIKKEYYEKGTKISEINYKTTIVEKVNDSLVTNLKLIDKDFYKYADSLQIASKTFGRDSKQYNRLALLNSLQTSKSLNDLDKIISKYGYPGKTLVGKDYAIAFSMISYADIEYKEKYYHLIIDAANKGDLDWSDVAFFVDKVKVAKKENQVYGTQNRYDEEHNKQLFYPIEEKEKLNERRKKIGLSEVDISTLDFLAY